MTERELTEGEMSAFIAHIDQLAEDAGYELDDEDRLELFQQSQERGFTPQATAAAFTDWSGDDEEADAETGTDRLVRHLQDDVARLSGEYGRPLTARETEIIAQGALMQAERYDQVNAEEALEDHYRASGETRPDTRTQTGRQEFIRQRLSESEPEREVPDEIDMTTSEGRSQYYDARLNGGFSADDFTDVGGEAA